MSILPEVKIKISDFDIRGCTSLDITRNLSVDADTLSVSIPNPEGRYSSWLSEMASEKRTVTVWVDKLRRFHGIIDSVNITMDRQGGQIFSIEARDYTAKLMEMPIPKGLRSKCKGLSASQIICKIGAELGVLVNAEATTRVWPGSWIWKEGATVWGVIKELALKEGFLAYVDHYQQVAIQIENPAVIVFRAKKGTEVVSQMFFDVAGKGMGIPVEDFTIDLDKSEAISKVTVVTYDPARAKAIRATAKAENASKDAAEITITDGSLKDKNLAKERAERELRARSKVKVSGSFTHPYFIAINPEDRIQLINAGDGIDGVYYVIEVSDGLSKQGAKTAIKFDTELEYQISTETRES